MLWGSTWGGLWGGPTIPAYAPDGVFASQSGTGSTADLAIDISGQADNLEDGTGYVFDENTTRGNLIDTRTIDVVADFDDADTGAMWAYSDASMVLTTGDISLVVNGSTVLTHTIANITASTVESFVVSWATEPNPLTTGASDAYRSELHVWNTTLDTYESVVVLHAAQAADTADLVFLAADTSGTNAFTGTAYKLRLSSAFHSSAETYESYVGISSPTAAGVTKLEFPLPDRSQVTLGDDGELDGPIRLMAARALQDNDMRLIGPAVNEIGSGAWAEDSTWTDVDPNDANYTMHAEWVFRRPIPVHCNRVQVRCHVQQNSTAAFDLNVRVYSSNRPGLISVPAPSVGTDAALYYDTVTRNADDGTADTGGAWISFDPLRVARDDDGYCYFWFGFFADVAGTPDYRIRSVSIDPIVSDTDGQPGGGVGFG